MSILLCGGAGYIGSHTCMNLLESGQRIVVADNFSNSDPVMLDRVKQYTKQSFPIYEIDIIDKDALDQIFRKEDITAVIHFAGLKAVGESVANPLLYYHTNINASLSLFETMQRHHVHKLVFSSSATVYSKHNPSPMSETAKLGGSSPYGWTKLMIEQILRDLATANPSWQIALLRYFNPVGAHESGLIGEMPNGIPNNLMPAILDVAAGKKPELLVYGNDYDTPDGTCVRDYIHVMDLAEGHRLALDHLETHPGAHTFNLGTGTGYSVLDLIGSFERSTGVSIPHKVTSRRPGDMPVSFSDPAKAEKELCWKAARNLDEMCRSSWNFRKLHDSSGHA